MSGVRDHPREQVRKASVRFGKAELVRRCVGVLRGADPPDVELLEMLGDPSWRPYWYRTWALRAFLYVWRPEATPAVVDALGGEHWRPREMAAKVIALREIGEAADALLPLVSDVTPRVRVGAVRALGVVGEGEHTDAVLAACGDADPAVHTAAERAVIRLEARLDRPLRP